MRGEDEGGGDVAAPGAARRCAQSCYKGGPILWSLLHPESRRDLQFTAGRWRYPGERGRRGVQDAYGVVRSRLLHGRGK